MKIHDLPHLSTDIRRDYPYAVVVNEDAVRFSSKPAATLYAYLLDTDCAPKVRRFVAILEDEYLSETEIPGWREVSYFDTEEPAQKG